MGEKTTVIKDLNVEFEGVFSLKGVYKLIDDYFDRLGFDKKEKKSKESVTKSGKWVNIELEYDRSLNDYTKAIHEIEIVASDITQVDVKRKDARVRLNKGKLKIETKGKIETETEGKWEGKPVYYFLRVWWNKQVWSGMNKAFESDIKDNAKHLIAEIRAYLNLGKY